MPPNRTTVDKPRARGALLGLAVGDALGTTQEFSEPEATPFPTLAEGPQREIVGGDASVNARILRDVLGGQKGAPRDATLANAAAALVAAEAAPSLREGVRLAAASIDQGAAADKLARLVKATAKA